MLNDQLYQLSNKQPVVSNVFKIYLTRRYFEVCGIMFSTIRYPTIIVQLRYYRSDTNACNVYMVNRMTGNKRRLTKIIRLP